MKLSKGNKAIVITIICFALFLFAKRYFSPIKTYLDGFSGIGLVSYILTYIVVGIPIYIGTYLVDKEVNILKNLGIWYEPFKPLLLAFLFSLPMLFGGYFFFEISDDIQIQNLIAGTIVAGFVEELFYRGFLFGMVYKYSRLGFVSSILLGAIIFASGHLYQSQDVGVLMGVFAITFMGAVLFAWLYVEWNYNLWVPIFLHTLMNFSWHFYAMDSTALGGAIPNILRGGTIAFAIVFTIMYKRKRNLPMAITLDKLIAKKNQMISN